MEKKCGTRPLGALAAMIVSLQLLFHVPVTPSHVITPSPSLPHVDGSVELVIRGMSSQDITGFLLNNTRLPF